MAFSSENFITFARNRPLQKRERTGKEYGCCPFVWKTDIFKGELWCKNTKLSKERPDIIATNVPILVALSYKLRSNSAIEVGLKEHYHDVAHAQEFDLRTGG